MAAAKAKMGLTFVKLGLHPGMAATHFLPLIAGPQVAADMLLTGGNMRMYARLRWVPVAASVLFVGDQGHFHNGLFPPYRIRVNTRCEPP